MIETQKKSKKYFSEKDLWKMAWQISKAVLYMHAHNVIHWDIKALNTFVFEDKLIKIGDLGESRILNS